MSGMVIPLEVPLSHRIILALLGFLFYHMKLIIVLSRSVKISDPKNSTRELLQLIKTFINVAGYKINSKKSVALLYTNDKEAEREIRETLI